MPISRVGVGNALGTTITIPAGHQFGDLIIIYAMRTAVTAPSLPAGWTNLGNGSSGASSFRCGYKYATSSSETSGTWTNATALICVVYRGANMSDSGGTVPPFSNGTYADTGTNTTPSYRAIRTSGPVGWVLAFGFDKANANGIGTVPTGSGLTAIVGGGDGSTIEWAAFDSAGESAGWRTAATGSLSASKEWRTFSGALIPAPVSYVPKLRPRPFQPGLAR